MSQPKPYKKKLFLFEYEFLSKSSKLITKAFRIPTSLSLGVLQDVLIVGVDDSLLNNPK